MPEGEGPVSPSNPITPPSNTPTDDIDLDAIFAAIDNGTYDAPAPVHVKRKPLLQIMQEAFEAKRRERLPERSVPSCLWPSLSLADRRRELCSYAQHQVTSVAFSLNFSAKRAKQLMKAGNNGRDPARVLSRLINNAMEDEFGKALPLAFIFEFTRLGRLHCHGFAVLPAINDDTMKAFRRALKKAGGVVTGLGSGRQCDTQELYDAIGWHGYCHKEAERTAELLGTKKIFYVSADLRKATEDDYNRRRMEAKKPKDSEPATEAQGESPTTSGVSDTAPAPDDSQRPSMAVSIDRQIADLIAGTDRDLTQRELDIIESIFNTT
jgi:hypothetical protein